MAQLRYLNNEVWKRFQFFVWLELVLFLLAGGSIERRALGAGLVFFVLMLSVGLVARWVLLRNRVYYLQMLAKKSLLEDELGLYNDKFPGIETDHAFPWRLTPEIVHKIKADFDGWVNSNIRSKGTIARPLFIILETFITLAILGLLIILIAALRHHGAQQPF